MRPSSSMLTVASGFAIGANLWSYSTPIVGLLLLSPDCPRCRGPHGLYGTYRMAERTSAAPVRTALETVTVGRAVGWNREQTGSNIACARSDVALTVARTPQS